jgi:hypothetical protein
MMLNFFLSLTFGMLCVFAALELYSRTIGRFLANRRIAKLDEQFEMANEFDMNADVLLFGETTRKSKRL